MTAEAVRTTAEVVGNTARVVRLVAGSVGTAAEIAGRTAEVLRQIAGIVGQTAEVVRLMVGVVGQTAEVVRTGGCSMNFVKGGTFGTTTQYPYFVAIAGSRYNNWKPPRWVYEPCVIESTSRTAGSKEKLSRSLERGHYDYKQSGFSPDLKNTPSRPDYSSE